MRNLTRKTRFYEMLRCQRNNYLDEKQHFWTFFVIFPREPFKAVIKLPLFSALARRASAGVSVVTSIEGDEIALEGVSCPRVTGRIVAIERGCNIELVQYSETVEISPDAKVGRTEKI